MFKFILGIIIGQVPLVIIYRKQIISKIRGIIEKIKK